MKTAESRRVFLNSRTIAGTLFTGLTLAPVHAGERNELKVGLIGCGGRGNGAAVNTFVRRSQYEALRSCRRIYAKGAERGGRA